MIESRTYMDVTQAGCGFLDREFFKFLLEFFFIKKGTIVGCNFFSLG